MRTFQPDLGITATLNFEGCITEKNIDAAPQLSGIYVAWQIIMAIIIAPGLTSQ